MNTHHTSPVMHHKSSAIGYKIFAILLLVSLACGQQASRTQSIPTAGQPGVTQTEALPLTATATAIPTSPPPAPTSTPAPLPPTLLETDPLPGALLPLNGAVTLYFNQPMDRASVEGALSGQPTLSGGFNWSDDATLTFTPDQPFSPDTSLTINIAGTAQSQNGLAMQAPVSISYFTTGYLNIAQLLPDADAVEVDPSSAVVAAFNRPVVPLGADPASLPSAFTIEPSAAGTGEWINTSTYIFYPDPALAGGSAYTARINPALKGVDGSPLESAASWSFTTAAPRLVSVTPADGETGVRLDSGVKLTFNQSMDPASVAANFDLQDSRGQSVAGQTVWDEKFTTLTFTPTATLSRDTLYNVVLESGATARGGTPLGKRTQASWRSVPELQVLRTIPAEGGAKTNYQAVSIYLSSFVLSGDLSDYITVSPEVSNLSTYFDASQKILYVNGFFTPSTHYTLNISPDLTDLWGSRLGQQFTLHIYINPPDAGLTFSYSTDSNFLTTQDLGILAQVTNIYDLPMSVGTVALQDFIGMLGPNGYDARRAYQPADARSWDQQLDIQPDRNQTVTIPLTPNGKPAAPGMYFVRFSLPQSQYYGSPLLVAVSSYHATFKVSSTEAFVWATDLGTNQPAPGVSVSVYDENGNLLTQGQTDRDGVFRGSIPPVNNPYSLFYAVLGQPGQRDFGLAVSNWNDAVGPWDFELQTDYSPAGIYAYVYTDRPIYRPGQTIYFRAVVRQAFNGRYTLPDLGSYSLKMYDQMGAEIGTFDLPLSAFGTAYGEYTLPPDAQPGYYRLANDDNRVSLSIQVANYRKPEINLSVSFQQDQILSGQNLNAQVNARYFFDAPAGNLPVHWALYKTSATFNIPGGYQVGPVDTGWLDVFFYPCCFDQLGERVDQGDAQTDANGLLSLDLSTQASQGRQKYTLEVTIKDESGLPVSARATLQANPADYYIGVRPDAWSGQAGQESGFEVLTVDWNGDSSPNRALSAQFQKVVWVRQDPSPDQIGYAFPTYVPEYTPVASADFTTGADGKARLSFTPSEPGTYQLDISGGGTVTQVLMWIGGPGQATWPNLPNQHLRLTADRDAYQPGDTAQVFIPNPFGEQALGLLTVERDLVMRYQVLHLDPGGTTIPLPLSDEDAPNVYIAVTLLGRDDQGNPDFRQGYLEIPVEPVNQTLNVSLTSQPERTGPGDTVTFSLRVTDASGSPVQGEFSLSVVDLAALALADPNAPDILTAFYGQQPLGVRTGISLAASAQRLRYVAGGLGGGGGEEATTVARENFPDTAYWEATVVTDANGEATVNVTLPDNLTTWQVLARGLTADTLVGEAQVNIVATKDLLVRPVTPRFLVAGDHLQLAAVVQNNTASDLQSDVTLQATGFELDDSALATQSVRVPANGRARLEWWGTAQDVPSADLLFSAQSGSYTDAIRVASGALPVLRYSAPQTFATSGVMDQNAERLEVVSLPVTFDARSGDLSVELAPSLGAAMLDTLDALEYYPYDCNEQLLSRFLANLETYITLQSFGLEDSDLKARLDRTLAASLQALLARQNSSGGWGWWTGGDLDPYITAYVLFGLASTQQAGITVPADAIQRAINALNSVLITPGMTSEAWQLDQLAFENFALAQAGAGNSVSATQLYSVRDQLSPWGQAALALTLQTLSPGSEQARTLASDLQTAAIRSATGAHWEDPHPDYRNLSTTLTTSAIVVYALAQLDPASSLLPDAVNYLISNRQSNGMFGSTYESAWSVLALTQYMRGSGELGGDFTFGATLNGAQIATGQAGGAAQLTPVVTSLPLSTLYSNDPNALLLQRGPGTGRLYYTAALNVYRPVEDVAPLDKGISVMREYFVAGSDLKTAAPIQSAQAGSAVTVRLTVVLPNDAYYLAVEDYIPAGAEILDASLKTSQLGEYGEPGPLYDPSDPFASGWGWWLFQPARIFDDHITWSANYLPAGSYQLTYTLVILQAGQYHVLPARAWMFYFPEVQGNSAGTIFEIKP